MGDYLDRMAKTIYCDSCGKEVDQNNQPGRWRHTDCPVPALPAAAVAVLEQIARMRGKR